MGHQQFHNPIKVRWRWHLTFGDDSKGTIIGIGNIKIGPSPLIENVVLVDGLKHNLLSISQLCDGGLKVIFDESSCKIFYCKTNECILTGFRENNDYIIDMLNVDCMIGVKPRTKSVCFEIKI